MVLMKKTCWRITTQVDKIFILGWSHQMQQANVKYKNPDGSPFGDYGWVTTYAATKEGTIRLL